MADGYVANAQAAAAAGQNETPVSPARGPQQVQTPPTTPHRTRFRDVDVDEYHSDDEAFFKKADIYGHDRTALQSPTTMRVQRRREVQHRRGASSDMDVEIEKPVFRLPLSDEEKLDDHNWRFKHLKAKPPIDFAELKRVMRPEAEAEKGFMLAGIADAASVEASVSYDSASITESDADAEYELSEQQQKKWVKMVRFNDKELESEIIPRPSYDDDYSDCDECCDSCKLGAHEEEMIWVSVVVGLAAIGMQYWLNWSA